MNVECDRNSFLFLFRSLCGEVEPVEGVLLCHAVPFSALDQCNPSRWQQCVWNSIHSLVVQLQLWLLQYHAEISPSSRVQHLHVRVMIRLSAGRFPGLWNTSLPLAGLDEWQGKAGAGKRKWEGLFLLWPACKSRLERAKWWWTEAITQDTSLNPHLHTPPESRLAQTPTALQTDTSCLRTHTGQRQPTHAKHQNNDRKESGNANNKMHL